jgi:hypothetical protein
VEVLNIPIHRLRVTDEVEIAEDDYAFALRHWRGRGRATSHGQRRCSKKNDALETSPRHFISIAFAVDSNRGWRHGQPEKIDAMVDLLPDDCRSRRPLVRLVVLAFLRPD